MEKYHKSALDGVLVLSGLRCSSSIKLIKIILNYIWNILPLLLLFISDLKLHFSFVHVAKYLSWFSGVK